MKIYHKMNCYILQVLEIKYFLILIKLLINLFEVGGLNFDAFELIYLVKILFPYFEIVELKL